MRNALYSTTLKRIFLVLLLLSSVISDTRSADAVSNIWSSSGPAGAYVRSLVISPTATPTIYSGTNGSGIYKTSVGSASWTAVSTGLTNRTITALAVDSISLSTVYAGTAGAGVFKTINNGGTWSTTGLTTDTVNDIAVASGALYAATSTGGVYRSANGGTAWTQINTGISNLNITSIVLSPNFASDSIVYAGSSGGGIFKSTDRGDTWTAINTNITDLKIVSLAISPNYTVDTTIYAGTTTDGVFKSTSAGTTWASVNSGITAGGSILTLAIDPNTPTTLHAGTSLGLFSTTNGGGAWAAPATSPPSNPYVAAVAINPNSSASLFAGTGGGVFESTDSGASWTALSTGITGTDAVALAINPAATSQLFTGTNGGGIFFSNDTAASWASRNSGILNSFVQGISIDPNTTARVYAATLGGVYRSINSGTTWSAATTQPTTADVRGIALDSSATPASTLYAGSYGGGVFKSVNSGVDWAATTALSDQNVTSLAIDMNTVPPTVYAGTDGGGVFKSTNGGTAWSLATAGNSGLNSTIIRALAITPAKLYASTAAGVHSLGIPGGTQWSAVNNGLTNLDTLSIAASPANPSYIAAGTNGGGVFLSTSNGSNWTSVNTGLTSLLINALAIDGATPTNIHAGSATGGVSTLTMSPTITVTPVSPHSFGIANTVGPPSVQQITVGNSGTLDLTISSITASLFAADGSTFSPAGNGIAIGGTTPCPSTTPTIIPGGSCTLLFSFTPGTPVTNSATLSFASNDTATPSKSLVIDWAGGKPPAAAFTSPAGGSTVRNPITFTGTAIDYSGSGLEKVEVSLDSGATWHTATPKPTLSTWEYVWATAPGTGDGSYSVKARAKDNNGYIQTSLAAVAVTLTNTAPDTAIDTGPSPLEHHNNATFTFSASKYGAALPGALFECKLDSGTYSSCTSPVSYINQIDGSHTFTVRAADGALPLPGNVDLSPASLTWVIDTTPPITSISSKPALFVNSTAAQFVFAANEANCTYICTFDGVGPALCTSPYNRSTLTEGNHTFTVQATDQATNQELTPISYTWMIDVTKPTSNIDAFAAPLTGTNYNFTGVSSDPLSVVSSGVSLVEVSFNGTTWFPATDTAVNPALPWSSWSYLWTLPANGSYTIQSRSTDRAGNIQQSPASANIVVANPLPTAAIGYPAVNANIGSASSRVITGTAAQAASGLPLQKVQVTVYPSATPPGSPTWVDATGTTSWSYSWTLPVDGAYTILARSLDSVGNISAIDSTNSRSVTVDVTPPTSTIDQPANPYMQGHVIQVSGAFNDNLSGVSTVDMTITNASNQTVSSGQAQLDTINKRWTYTSNINVPLPDGAYLVSSRSTDIAGNQQTVPGTTTITLDNVQPHTTINSTPVDPSSSSSPSFTFTADHTSTFVCTLDGVATACSSPKSYTGQTTGTHTFTVQATDLAGNQEPTPQIYSWFIDLVPPTITAVTPVNGASRVSISTPAITVTFDKAVNPATVTTATFSLTTGGAPVIGSISMNTANTVATFTPTALLSYASDYTAAVTSGIRDPAGNTLSAGRTWSFSTDPDGDINLDGRVDIADAILALKVSVGRVTISATAFRHGDVGPLVSGSPQPDGILDGRDAMIILGKSIGKHNW